MRDLTVATLREAPECEQAYQRILQYIGEDKFAGPAFNPIRSDPGFNALLRKMNLPEFHADSAPYRPRRREWLLRSKSWVEFR